MGTRETVLTTLTIILAFTLVPTALAQDEDPSLNESEMDTNPPASDESYLDEAEQESTTASDEPTLTESEMDTTAPAFDESYLDEAEREMGGSGAADEDAAKGTPGVPIVGILVGLGLVALAQRGLRR